MNDEDNHVQRNRNLLAGHSRVESKLSCGACRQVILKPPIDIYLYIDRARHLKCEENEPGQVSCRTCLKAGRKCDGIPEDTILPLSSPMPKVSRGELEEATFDQFVNRFAPWFGRFTDEAFWVRSVLPAAEGHDSVFSAALAVTAFFDMPINEALVESTGAQKRYQIAISWYRKSVNASIGNAASKRSVPDISLLLLTTVLYINVEMRLGHYHNSHNLIRTAFALAYSARVALWKSKDTTVLAALTQVLEAGIALAIDSICIPRSHRDFAMVLILRIASETGASVIDQLRFELLSIVYDVTDECTIAENAQKETCCIIFSMGPCPALSSSGTVPKEQEDVPFERNMESLEDRMRDWYKRFVMHKVTLEAPNESWSALIRQQTMFFQARAHWQAHILNKRSNMDSVALEERLSAILELFEELALKNPPVWITDMAIVPPCLNTIWYLRDQVVLARIVSIFKTYKIYNKNEFMENVLAYLETLVNTDFMKATEIELELFGHTPTILKKWHVYMCLQYLVRKKSPHT